MRALEAVMVSGKEWSGRVDLWAPDYYHPTVVVGLELDRHELYRRIDARSAQIVHEGAVEEVQRFRAERGAGATTPGGAGIRSAIGYPEICRYLAGEQTREQTIEQVASATRKYARRQLTWLRKLGGAVMIDVGGKEPSAVAREIGELGAIDDQIKEAHPE
jgi:tRNA dimethylallyltransferase